MGLVSELRRRNVLRMAVLYVVAAWLIVQVAGVLIDLAQLPGWIGTTTLWLLAIGFPIALIFSWFYEITPGGISLEKDVDPELSITHVTGRRLDFIVIALLCAAVILFAYDKWWIGPPPERSIAVLPFENVSGDPDQEYFSDGISEELIHLLAKISEFHVISRSSAFFYKGKNKNIIDVARELNVTYILDGSVRKSGTQVRITAQLIDARSDTHIWSGTFNRVLDDIFKIQNEIAENVVAELKVTLLGGVPKAKQIDSEAYSLYLQARHVVLQETPESYRQAMDLLRQVLSIDGSYAPAWSTLSSVYSGEVSGGLRPPAEGYEDARNAAARALKLDPSLASAHEQLALIAMRQDRDYSAAIKHLKAARARAPFSARASSLALILGRFDLAEEWGQQWIRFDPVSAKAYNSLAVSFVAVGRFHEADQAVRKALTLSPNHMFAKFNMARLRLEAGEPQAALDIAEEMPVEEAQLYLRSMAYFALGDNRRSDEQLDLFKQKFADESAFNIAEVHAFRDEDDLAFRWLEAAYKNQDTTLTGILFSPSMRKLISDRRMQPFLSKIGLSDEQRAHINLDLLLSE